MAFLIGDINHRWFTNIIPFEISPDFLVDDIARSLLAKAINDWNGSCNIKLIGHTDEPDFVVFRRDPYKACNSQVGRRGGRQVISCFLPPFQSGDILHEIGHAVGFIHEHQRPDRDKFVSVPPSVASTNDYRIERAGAIFTPYDCVSIMHYDEFRSPIRRKPGSCSDGIGNSSLSQFDIATINGLVLDSHSQNISLAHTNFDLYLLHADGGVFQYQPPALGQAPQWLQIDANGDNKQIVAGGGKLYLRHGDGGVFIYTGTPFKWDKIDANDDNEQIVAEGDQLYLRHGDGGVFIYTGTPFKWDKIDANDDNKQIVADGDQLYLRHGDGGVFIYTGTPFKWDKIDENDDNEQIVAAGGRLYLRHGDGGVFIYSGIPFRWVKIDANDSTKEIAAGGDQLYQRHDNGDVFRFTENLRWQLLHNGGAQNVTMLPHENDLYLIRIWPPFNKIYLSVTMLGYHGVPLPVFPPISR